MGLFITFEGIEGSGKSTQVRLLQAFLDEERCPYVATREPGGAPLGELIRDLVLDRVDVHIEPLAELLLIEADRAQHV